MNAARGLIKDGWFPEFDGGFPPLSMLVTTDTSDGHWSVTAHIVRLEKEDGKPRNLTGHPADDLVLRAQADRTSQIDPGRIYAYRIVKEGFSIDDLEDLQASVRAIKTINRRVAKALGDNDRPDFKEYFVAVAEALGAKDILFYDHRSSMYPESTFEYVGPVEAATRIEQSAQEARR